MLFALAAGAAPPRSCETVPLDELPLAARQALVSGAGDDQPLRVCRLRVGGAIVYRAHGAGSGITVDVSPLGDVLRRVWSAGGE